LLEEECAVVEDKVDTGELLPGLEEDGGEGTEADGVAAVTEAVHVGRLANFLFHPEGGFDFVELELEGFVVRVIRAQETHERGDGGFIAASFDEVTGGLREEDHADGKDECPDELNGNGDSVGRVVGAVLGCIVDNRGEEKTDSDGPLVQ